MDILEAVAGGYLATFRLNQATTTLDLLLDRQPNNVPAWVMRGKARYHLRGYSEGANNYGRAVDLAPDDPQARLLLAECLVENARPAQALEHFDRLSEQTPDDLAVPLGRANCLLDLGRTDEARDVLDRLLKRAPSNLTAMTL